MSVTAELPFDDDEIRGSDARRSHRPTSFRHEHSRPDDPRDETLPLDEEAGHPSHHSFRSGFSNRGGTNYGGSARFGKGARGEEREGDVVGDYKLLTELGEGGFGTVWLAKRVTEFDQKVAIKVVKQGLDSESVLERFRQEMQLLALMDHPHVAKVINGGRTQSGRPYFVMDYVDGRPLTKFADEHRLTIEERLRLFLQVCDAVQYAHNKEIVHRDLKPSNILVAPDGNGGANAKVIDFGIAKAVHGRLSDHCMAAESGKMVGTYEYMSPEQAEGDDKRIKERSDVYSLGVILYELLVGAVPFGSRELRSKSQEEIRLIIREAAPLAPVDRLNQLQRESVDQARRLAELRRMTPSRHMRTVGGELGWIPLKAMSKDPEERYQSAHRLAEDIRNYLARRTVEAVPPMAVYRARKYVRRHRVSLVMGCCMALALGSFAHRYFTETTAAQPLHPDPSWLVDVTARDRNATQESLAFAIKVQEEAINATMRKRREVHVARSDDERSARELEAQARKGDAVGSRLIERHNAIEQRNMELGDLTRTLTTDLAQLAWLQFRMAHREQAISTMRGAVDMFNRIDREGWLANDADQATVALLEDALRHFELMSPSDPPPALWSDPPAAASGADARGTK